MNGIVTIASNGLGITARGNINVNGGATTVTTDYGTGIYVNGGTFRVESDATISVTSTVRAGYAWGLPPEGQGTAPNIYNGVYVQGGSLISNGTLNVNFTGVRNDAQAKSGTSFLENESIGDIEWIGQLGSYAIEVGTNESDLVRYQALIDATLQNNSQVYQTFTIKSFAVRIEQPQGEQSEVKIEAGKITNSVGGGVLVNGGTVTLGAEDEGEYNETTQRGLTIQTSGLETLEDEDTYYVTGTGTYTTGYWPFRETHYCITFSQGYIPIEGTYRNWSYKQPSTGGDAVKVVDGTLNVLGGSYQAAQGNGILVSGATTTEDGDYAVEISGGTFVGNDSYNNIEGNAMPGAAASYGLKMYGGSLQVTGGTFGSTASRGSGAFVMGERNDSETSYATASILAGTFAAGGTAGLSVYYGANVYIGGDEAGASGTGIPTFQGNSAGMTVETYASDIGDSHITVYRGSFTGVTQDGIWYGGALTYLTIYRSNVTLSGPRAGVQVAVSSSDRITYYN